DRTERSGPRRPGRRAGQRAAARARRRRPAAAASRARAGCAGGVGCGRRPARGAAHRARRV
ncbi:MAG: hypothetical protein AVDCRST_MAG16-360, partial [uncultured Frankineae bacterium]